MTHVVDIIDTARESEGAYMTKVESFGNDPKGAMALPGSPFGEP
jgi:hypothetical protein